MLRTRGQNQIWEERHGQGSDAQQQGEEKTEGRVEQEEEGRPRPLAVRPGPGANPARADAAREEDLAAPGAAAITPRRSSSPQRNGGRRSSTSAGTHRRPDCPTSSIPCAYRARTARDRVPGYTPR